MSQSFSRRIGRPTKKFTDSFQWYRIFSSLRALSPEHLSLTLTLRGVALLPRQELWLITPTPEAHSETIVGMQSYGDAMTGQNERTVHECIPHTCRAKTIPTSFPCFIMTEKWLVNQIKPTVERLSNIFRDIFHDSSISRGPHLLTKYRCNEKVYTPISLAPSWAGMLVGHSLYSNLHMAGILNKEPMKLVQREVLSARSQKIVAAEPITSSCRRQLGWRRVARSG